MALAPEGARREAEVDEGRDDEPPADPRGREHVPRRRDQRNSGRGGGQRDDAGGRGQHRRPGIREEQLAGVAPGEQARRRRDERPPAVGAIDRLVRELGHVEGGRDDQDAAEPRDPGADEAGRAAARGDGRHDRSDRARDDRRGEVAGPERDRDEGEGEGVRAGRGAGEDERLPESLAVPPEPATQRGDPGKQAGLGALRSLGRGQEPGDGRCQCQCCYGDRSSARDRVVEDRPRRHVHEGHVRRRESEVRERHQLQPRVAQAPCKRAEEQRLCGPGDGQAGPGHEVHGGHGSEGQRGDAENEREIGLVEAAQRRPRGRPDRGCDGQRDAEVAPVGVEKLREAEREPDGSEDEGGREPVELDRARAELEPDAGGQEQEHERRLDRCRPGVRRALGRGSQPGRLGSHDGRDRDQQPVPAAWHRKCDGSCEHDYGKGDRHPLETAVERLQPGCQRRPEQADAGDDLGVPGQRDQDGDDRDQAREGKCEPVGNEVVVRGRGGEARVAARDACSHRADGRQHLAVAPAHPEAGADGARRDDGPERDAHPRRDPATVRGEHEQQDDAEGGDAAADDGEAARAEQIPVARQVGDRATRRRRGSRRGRRGTRSGGRGGRSRRHALGRPAHGRGRCTRPFLLRRRGWSDSGRRTYGGCAGGKRTKLVHLTGQPPQLCLDLFDPHENVTLPAHHASSSTLA